MGIPGFYGHWITNFIAAAVLTRLPDSVDTLAFDLNGVIHDARKQVYDVADTDPRIAAALGELSRRERDIKLFETVDRIILTVLRAVNPQKALILTVDGTANLAKGAQQRGRRSKAALTASPNSLFDGNAITPGTEFMRQLNQHIIIDFIGKYRNYLPPTVIYSSHLVPGEGEHKIMEYYRNGTVAAGGNHVLYGLDADLIMLSLVSPLPNIFLCRERMDNVVDIGRVAEYLRSRSGRPSAVADFVVMMYLIGNDFLPHQPSLEALSQSIEALLDIYRDSPSLTLTLDNGGISWPGLALFLSKVAAQENAMLVQSAVKDYKYPARLLKRAVANGNFYPETYRTLWYENALGGRNKDLTAELSNILGVPLFEVTPERIGQMCIDYFKTMAWCYQYYTMGTAATNAAWYYPYYHTPLLFDLANIAPDINDEVVAGYKNDDTLIPFTALHQMVAVLPLRSKDLLPNELLPVTSYTSIIRDLYPETFIIEIEGKNVEHEGVPIIPFVDRERILAVVSTTPFTYDRAVLWLPATDEVFTRTESEQEYINKMYQLSTNNSNNNNNNNNNSGARRSYASRDNSRDNSRSQTATVARPTTSGVQVIAPSIVTAAPSAVVMTPSTGNLSSATVSSAPRLGPSLVPIGVRASALSSTAYPGIIAGNTTAAPNAQRVDVQMVKFGDTEAPSSSSRINTQTNTRTNTRTQSSVLSNVRNPSNTFRPSSDTNRKSSYVTTNANLI